jgi:hypothetical protein
MNTMLKTKTDDYVQVLRTASMEENIESMVAKVEEKMSRYLGPYFNAAPYASPMLVSRLARKDFRGVMTYIMMSTFRGRFQLFTSSLIIELLSVPFAINFVSSHVVDSEKNELESKSDFTFSFLSQKQTLMEAKIVLKNVPGSSTLNFKLTKENSDTSEFSYTHDFSETSGHAALLSSIHDVIMESWRTE